MFWGISRDLENGLKAELGPMSVQGEAAGFETGREEKLSNSQDGYALFSLPFCVLNPAPLKEHHRFTHHFINKFKLKTGPFFNPNNADYLYIRGRKVRV